MRRVMVTGSRKWPIKYAPIIRTVLAHDYQETFKDNDPNDSDYVVVHGGALQGVDIFTSNWVMLRAVTEEVHLPDLKKYGSPQAYHQRNWEMASSEPDFAFVFFYNRLKGYSRGTDSAYQQILRYQVPHKVFSIDDLGDAI